MFAFSLAAPYASASGCFDKETIVSTVEIYFVSLIILHFDCSESVQTYSFVLTSTDSKWRFGFCRHDTKTQNAMVIITYLPWHDTFKNFMNVLGELKRSNNGEFQPFLSEAYNKGVPETGASLKLFYNGGINVCISLSLSSMKYDFGYSNFCFCVFFSTSSSNNHPSFSCPASPKIII